MSPDQPAAEPTPVVAPAPEAPVEPALAPAPEAPVEPAPAPEPAPEAAPEPAPEPAPTRPKRKAAAKKPAPAPVGVVKDPTPQEEAASQVSEHPTQIDGSGILLQTNQDVIDNFPKNSKGQVEIDEDGKIVGL